MPFTKVQKQILFALGQYYNSLNQPLVEKPLRLSTSKIAFIELLQHSQLVSKQERALYKNLETLEGKKLIDYNKRMIKFTDRGLKELNKITAELKDYSSLEKFFQRGEKPRRKLQTVILNQMCCI